MCLFMAYTPYSPPSQQTAPQYTSSQQYPQQPMMYQQSTYQAPAPRVIEHMEKDITEILTPKITAGVIIASVVIVYIGVVIALITNGITLFHIGKILAGLGILIFSIVPALLSMQERLEPRHRATYYAIPVLAIIALVLLI